MSAPDTAHALMTSFLVLGALLVASVFIGAMTQYLEAAAHATDRAPMAEPAALPAGSRPTRHARERSPAERHAAIAAVSMVLAERYRRGV